MEWGFDNNPVVQPSKGVHWAAETSGTNERLSDANRIRCSPYAFRCTRELRFDPLQVYSCDSQLCKERANSSRHIAATALVENHNSCRRRLPGLSPLRQSRAPNRASLLQKAQTGAACDRNHCRTSSNLPHSKDHNPNRFALGWQDARGTSSFHVYPGIWFRQACASERLGLSI